MDPSLAFQPDSFAGLQVWVALPPDGAAGRPVLLGLHGRGSGPEELERLCATFGSGYIHVLARAPFEHLGRAAWYSDGPDHDAEVASSRARLLELLGHLRQRFSTGPELTGVWGFSQGGRMSLELGLRSPSPLAATVCASGRLEPATRDDASVMRRARGRSFFLVHGVKDSVVPSSESRVAFQALTAHGAKVELAEVLMGHEISPLAAGAIRGFLASTLPEGRAFPQA